MPDAAQRTPHHFTVDVEEHFQVAALARAVPRAHWDRLESRVVANTMRLLEMLESADAKGTFFTLGWVAARHAGLVRAIAEAGHEVGSHGWGHRKVTEVTPAEFRESVRRSKGILEDMTGTPVLGYRAPSFSIVRGGEWALQILVEEGYRYDSSLFPIRRPGYGYSAAPRDPHVIATTHGPLMEFPPATLRIAGAQLPAGGGAYLRLLPYRLVDGALQAAERRGVPGTFYIHPWEVDPEQPRFRVPAATRIRHYGGLKRTAARLERLLSRFRFRAIASSLDDSFAPPRPQTLRADG